MSPVDTRTAALVAAIAAIMLLPLGAGQTGHASMNVEQSATADGGTVAIEQSSTVRTATDDGHTSQRTEQQVTKQAGEPAMVNRTVSRDSTLPDDQVQYNVQRNVTETDTGVTASQTVHPNSQAASADTRMDAADVDTDTGMADTRQPQQQLNPDTAGNAASDGQNAAEPGEQDAVSTTVEQGVTAIDDIVARIAAAITGLFGAG